jgi:hypothetical protein
MTLQSAAFTVLTDRKRLCDSERRRRLMRPDPVEIVAVALPVLLEVVVVVAFLGMIAVWAALVTGQVPA